MTARFALALLLTLCATAWPADGRNFSSHVGDSWSGLQKHGGRRLLGCSLTFQARRSDQVFDKGYRLATLQDVTVPAYKSLQGVLNDGDVALLVDGWTSFSDHPPQTYAGSNDRDFVLRTKLGIRDCGIADDLYGPGWDLVPKGADPNRMLQKRHDPSLEKRGATFFPFNKRQERIIRDLISTVTLTQIDTAKQKTLYGPTPEGFRIDKQGNEVITIAGKKFVQLAVQAADKVYASVIVPYQEKFTYGQIRLALYSSLEQAKVIPFETPPPAYKGNYKWLIAVGAAFALFL